VREHLHLEVLHDEVVAAVLQQLFLEVLRRMQVLARRVAPLALALRKHHQPQTPSMHFYILHRLCRWYSSSRFLFTARRYASAVFAVVVCASVRPSVTSRYCIETAGRIELRFGMDDSFHLSHAML